jgi:BioD-like phosphotransacetylase family protein
LFLTGDQDPHADVLAAARHSGMPILKVNDDVYETVEAIDASLAKTLATDKQKLDIIDNIYEKALDWDRIFEIIES